MRNPWHDLPTKDRYILPVDDEYIKNFRNTANLRLETLPGQFAGGFDSAEVVLLALNPGFDQRDIDLTLAMPDFLKAIRRNHTDPYGSPFYFLDPAFKETGGYEW